VTVTGKRVVILKAFVKKTQKTPLKELATARERAKELE
jgi:phage-related protein